MGREQKGVEKRDKSGGWGSGGGGSRVRESFDRKKKWDGKGGRLAMGYRRSHKR